MYCSCSPGTLAVMGERVQQQYYKCFTEVQSASESGKWDWFHLGNRVWISRKISSKRWHLSWVIKNSKTDSKKCSWASLVAQWLRIRLLMKGTWVWALVREDPTCRGATKPVHHNYWACALEPASHNYWAHVPQLRKPALLEPVLCNQRSHRNEKPTLRNEEYPCSPQLEKARAQQWRPNAAKSKLNKISKFI